MAIRTINWMVGADCKTVTPAAVQDGGVQGEDNAARVVFDLSAATALTDGSMTFHVECIDCMGGYDKTSSLPLTDGTVSTLVPLAWTQHGGVVTLRLVCEAAGIIAYTLEGRLRFAGRQTATRQVDTLLRTHIQQTLDGMAAVYEETRSEAENAQAAAQQAATATDGAVDAANEAAIYAGKAAASEEGAKEALAESAEHAEAAKAAAEAAQATEQRIATLAIPDDDTVRRDGLWSSQNIVDRLCPPFEKSGKTVEVYPVEGYPLVVKTEEPWNYLDLSFDLFEENGLRLTTTDDGGFALNGTMGLAGALYLSCPVGTLAEIYGLDPTETYRLSGCPAGGSAEGYRLELWEDSTGIVRVMDTGEGAAFVPGDYTYAGIWILSISMPTGTVCDNLTFYPRITKADETATTITRCGKNLVELAPVKTTISGMTCTVNEDGGLTLNGTSTATTAFAFYGAGVGTNAAPFPKYFKDGGTTYCVSVGAPLPTGLSIQLFFYDDTGASQSSAILNEGETQTTFKKTAARSLLYLYLRIVKGTTIDNLTIYPMIEQGSVATAYEPYREDSFPVDASGTTKVAAAEGYNLLCADAGEITVTGRLDPVRILQNLM